MLKHNFLKKITAFHWVCHSAQSSYEYRTWSSRATGDICSRHLFINMKVPLVQTLIYMFNTIFQIVYSCKSIIPILIHTRISFTTVTAVLDHVLVWVTHVRTNDPQKKNEPVIIFIQLFYAS